MVDPMQSVYGPTAPLSERSVQNGATSVEVQNAALSVNHPPHAAMARDSHAIGKASRFVSGAAGSASGSADTFSGSAIRSSTWRSSKARSSSRFRRSQPVTSSLHLLVLQEGQAGTTFSSVYRPSRDSGGTQSRRSGLSVAPQAHPPQGFGARSIARW
jgi:hypothetical protein